MCGIVGGEGGGGGGLEKISKANSHVGWSSRGVEKSGKFNSRRGWGWNFVFSSFLTIKTTYCRTFYIY